MTLVGPPQVAEHVIELMLEHEPPVRGFTTWAAEGHGFGFESASLREKIRGRVERRVIVAVTTRAVARTLLNAIETTVAAPHLTHWIEPVESIGLMLSPPPLKPSAAFPLTQSHS